MKKLLIVATLSITVAAVTKRVARRKTVTLNFVNKNELETLLGDTKFYAKKLDQNLNELRNFKPSLHQG